MDGYPTEKNPRAGAVGRFSDALIAVKRSWASESTGPVPFRFQGSDPLVGLDEVPQIAQNMLAGKPLHLGLPATLTPTARVTTAPRRAVTAEPLW